MAYARDGQRWKTTKRALVAIAAALGLAAPARADFLIPNLADGNVVRYNPATGVVTEFIPEGAGGLDSPVGLRYGSDGYIYITNQNTSQVLRYHGVTGAFHDVFVAANSGGLVAPADLRFGPGGDLYVANLGGTDVMRYSGVDGSFKGAFTIPGGVPPKDPLQQPNTLRFHTDGNLYVSGLGSNSVERYSAATGEHVDTFVATGTSPLSGATAHAFGPDGNLYVAGVLSGNIERFNGATGAFMNTFAVGMLGANTFPTSLLFADDGFLYVTAQGAGGVQKFSYDANTATFVSFFLTGTAPGGISFGAQPAYIVAQPISGDANADGAVDIFDVNTVSDHWGAAGPGGDVNGDGAVDIFDVNTISDNWGETGGGSALTVPEPASALIALLSIAVWLARRKRAKST